MNFEKLNNINFNDNYYERESFPEITVSHLPQEILIMIKRMYSGSKSEITSVAQSIYQHFVTSADSRLCKLSQIIKQIAIRDMMHYEMLAKILVKCGIDPKNCIYIDGNPNLCDYWKASSVAYEKSLIKIFESNVMLKKRCISEYNEIINKTDNENLKQILTRIIQDEETHLIYFLAVLKELKN